MMSAIYDGIKNTLDRLRGRLSRHERSRPPVVPFRAVPAARPAAPARATRPGPVSHMHRAGGGFDGAAVAIDRAAGAADQAAGAAELFGRWHEDRRSWQDENRRLRNELDAARSENQILNDALGAAKQRWQAKVDRLEERCAALQEQLRAVGERGEREKEALEEEIASRSDRLLRAASQEPERAPPVALVQRKL